MEYMYIRRDGDSQVLTETVKSFEASDNESFISAYNGQFKCGITGVHAQALYLMAMGHVFFKRFGKSPIYMENNILGMRHKIMLSGESYEIDERPQNQEKEVIPPKIIVPREHLGNLIIEEEKRSPSIFCDSTKAIIEIKGECFWGSNSRSSYNKLLEWIKNFGEMRPTPLIVTIRLQYLISVGRFRIFLILMELERLHERNQNVQINWFYDEDNEIMLETGTRFSEGIKIPFRIIPEKNF